MSEQEALIFRLKKQSVEIAISGVPEWGKTMTEARGMIEQQAAEIKALRGFSQAITGIDFSKSINVAGFVDWAGVYFGLIDENGNRTALLTVVKE